MKETSFCEVAERYNKLEDFKIQNYSIGSEISERFGQLYSSWEETYFPINEIENYQIGIGLNNGTYNQWKECGFMLTPKLIAENLPSLKEEMFLNWLYRSDTYGLEWMEEKILKGECPPILVSNKRLFSSGDFIDGQHRAFIYSLLKSRGSIPKETLVPVIIGRMKESVSCMYNAYLFTRMEIPMQDKVILFKQRFNKGEALSVIPEAVG